MYGLRMKAEKLRLNSILAQLPRPRRVLELGCGSDPITVGPDATHLGIDLDGEVLRANQSPGTGNVLLVQADIACLPLFARFDLILARHPDVDRHPESWHVALTRAPDYLIPGGVLLITVYSLPEVELIRNWAIPLRPYLLDERKMCATNLAGADRYALCWLTSATFRGAAGSDWRTS